MRHEEFIEKVEQYYGPYQNPNIRKVVFAYVKDKFRETELTTLFEQLITTYSGQYRFTPDVAIIEKASKEIQGQVGQFIDDNGNVFVNGQQVGYMDQSRFIPFVYLLDKSKLVEYKQNCAMYRDPVNYARLLQSMALKLVK